MEPKIVKVLDSSKYMVDFKRKRLHQVSIEKNGDSSFLVNLPESILAKRRKLNVYESMGNFHRPLGKSVVRYYLNFLKSGQPGRVLYYQGGDWISFPLPLLDLIKEHFTKKSPIFEVELNGNAYLLDFVHMTRFELKSGMQQSIAWIDEAGSCFFPEIVSHEVDAEADEAILCCHHEYGKTEEHAYEKEYVANEIKLQLEIDINVLAPSNFNECTGESDDLVEQDAVNKNSAKSFKKFDGFSAESGVNVHGTKNKQVGPGNKYMDPDNIKNLFHKVMGSSEATEIIDVFRGSSLMVQAREELFRKRVEITAKHRGDANVRYAWLPCTKDVSSSIMKYGIGSVALSSSIYGVGVHLSSADCANLSVNLSDVDENGVQYVVLCQVALGNMEVVNRGSDQFHPSSEDYDTGVDDLKSPKYHVIWNMDLNSRIYPECVISFKASSSSKGCNVEQEKLCDTSGVTASHGDRYKVLLESASNNMAIKLPGVHNVTSRTPTARKPAWMPFPILFAAISHRVSPSAMKLIMTEYDLFKKEKTRRDAFVRKLRSIVGDQLLMSTIKQLQCHQVQSVSENEVPPNLTRDA